MTLLHVHSSSPVPVIVHVAWLIAQQDLCDALLNVHASVEETPAGYPQHAFSP